MNTGELVAVFIVAVVLFFGSIFLCFRCWKAISEQVEDHIKPTTRRERISRAFRNSMRRSFRGMQRSAGNIRSSFRGRRGQRTPAAGSTASRRQGQQRPQIATVSNDHSDLHPSYLNKPQTPTTQESPPTYQEAMENNLASNGAPIRGASNAGYEPGPSNNARGHPQTRSQPHPQSHQVQVQPEVHSASRYPQQGPYYAASTRTTPSTAKPASQAVYGYDPNVPRSPPVNPSFATPQYQGRPSNPSYPGPDGAYGYEPSIPRSPPINASSAAPQYQVSRSPQYQSQQYGRQSSRPDTQANYGQDPQNMYEPLDRTPVEPEYASVQPRRQRINTHDDDDDEGGFGVKAPKRQISQMTQPSAPTPSPPSRSNHPSGRTETDYSGQRYDPSYDSRYSRSEGHSQGQYNQAYQNETSSKEPRVYGPPTNAGLHYYAPRQDVRYQERSSREGLDPRSQGYSQQVAHNRPHKAEIAFSSQERQYMPSDTYI